MASLECCDGVEVRAEDRGNVMDDNDKFQDDVRPSLTLGLGAGLASRGGLSCAGDIS